MSYLLIKKSGLHTSIQDEGRFGLAFYGIPQSGYMDPVSAKLANRIVGNELGNAVIECTYTAPSIEFGKNFIISITGANMGWTIDKNPIPRYTSLYVRKGVFYLVSLPKRAFDPILQFRVKWIWIQ